MIVMKSFEEIVRYFIMNISFKEKTEAGDTLLILSEDLNLPIWGHLQKIEIDKTDKNWVYIHFRVFTVPLQDFIWKVTYNMINGKEIFDIDGVKKYMNAILTEPSDDQPIIDYTKYVAPASNTIH